LLPCCTSTASITSAIGKIDATDAANTICGFLLWYCLAPYSLPGMLALFALTFTEGWNQVEQPLMLVSDSLRQPLSALLKDLSAGNPQIVFAASVASILPIALVMLVSAGAAREASGKQPDCVLRRESCLFTERREANKGLGEAPKADDDGRSSERRDRTQVDEKGRRGTRTFRLALS